MSSPLSMLKKTRRAPLQGPVNESWGRKVPFRRNPLRELKAELAAAHESSHRPSVVVSSTSQSQLSTQKGAPPSDFELMSVMMKRLTRLEETVRCQQLEIEHKDKQISMLEEKLRAREQSASVRDDDLERRCQQLQDQVCDMEGFLNDYGLIWVGDRRVSDAEECTSGDMNFHMNFDLVLQRIRELNVLAGEGESFVQTTTTGAQLARRDPVPLRLYKNGIVMFDGPFRSYQEGSAQLCMQDLMEGYFPSELQERFPDGVPFEVHDKRQEDFVSQVAWEMFPGEGQAVCEETDESPKAASSRLPGKKSNGEWMDRLPKMVVVKAGQVLDVRDSLRGTLQGSSDVRNGSLIFIDTPALRAMRERDKTSSPVRPSSPRYVITLKVKSEDGNHTYVLKMCLSETIGHLRHHLDAHRDGGLPGYDIISAFPRCRYDDADQTLRSCGLTTNTTLLLRKRHRSL